MVILWASMFRYDRRVYVLCVNDMCRDSPGIEQYNQFHVFVHIFF